VTLKHPDLPEAPPFETTRAAFDELWSEKGWEIDETADAAEEPPANLDRMTTAELEDLAETRRVNLDDAQNNAERAAAIRASYPSEA
jgi:hypothetical protein